MKIELETSERNYLYRLLENYEQYYKNHSKTEIEREYQLSMILRIKERITGKKLDIDIANSKSPINYLAIGGD